MSNSFTNTIIRILDNSGNDILPCNNLSGSNVISGSLPIIFISNGSNLINYEIYGNTNGVGDYDSTTQKYLIPITITGSAASQTITLSLDTPLTETQKITLADTAIDFPTYEGSNKITVGTTIQPSAVLVEGDFTFVSMGPEITYTVSYYNYDGQLLDTESVVTTLGIPVDANGYSGNTPTKSSTAQYEYIFSGWNTNSAASTADSNVLKNITADRAVYAIFTQTERSYTVSYYSQDGQTLIDTESVVYGHNASFSGTTPTKASTAQYTYTFSGWNTSTGQTTATANVLDNITADKSVYAAFSKAFKTDTISDSWEDIITACNNGTYSSKYQVGDLKTVDVGTEGPVQMQIVAIDTDLLASDNTKKAPITWISKQLLNTSAVMNSTSTNYLADWTNCDMRTYLKNTVLPMLPSIVQNNIKEVTKYTNQRTGSTTFTTISSTEDIWLPSYREVSNNTSYCETSGAQYNSIFDSSNTTRVKSKVGASGNVYWLRSASGYSSSGYFNCFADVYSSGKASFDGNICVSSYGVAIGFCT